MRTGKVSLELRYNGVAHYLKFFRGTPRAELLAFVKEQLGLRPAASLRFYDEEGDPTLLNAHAPSGTVLVVAVGGGAEGRAPAAAPRRAAAAPLGGGAAPVAPASATRPRPTSPAAGGALAEAAEHFLRAGLAEPEAEALGHEELLGRLGALERVLHAASELRRGVLDALGPLCARRGVFRADTPVCVRQRVFQLCDPDDVVHFAEVSRGFRSWVSFEGRRIQLLVDDRALLGGAEAGWRLAQRVHPSFISSVRVRRQCEGACAFLDAITRLEGGALASLEEVCINNDRYVSATLLIRVLQRAGCLRKVSWLARLDRPLPPECLRSVQSVSPLVLHSTQVQGFPSLFGGGPLASLREVTILDTHQMRFDALLGSLPAGALGRGGNLRHLKIRPHGPEPTSRCWESWIRPFAELLSHDALACLQCATVPVPSHAEQAAHCMRALVEGFRSAGPPRGLEAHQRFSICLLPYTAKARGFLPSGVNEARETEIDQLARGLQRSCRGWWPGLEVSLEGVCTV